MSQPNARTDSGQTQALADFAFGSHTQVVDVSRPLAWLSPEEMDIDLADPVQRRFGDYELTEKIGQGGMGVVYRARQHGLERDVAIKLLAAGPWASEEFVARFRREASSAARMQHPNIVEIYEFGHRDGLNYFSMRLIEGQTLAQRLYDKGPMPAGETARLLRTLAEAMDYAHRLGVLHLDLKPANVLIAGNGVPLIADFGLARRIDAGHEGGNDEISGSPSYMAPEQAMLASHPLSAATDIYGLGAILYEALTARPPFMGKDAQSTLERVVAEQPIAPRDIRRDIPADIEAICLKCLAKDPAHRYATARELADDLGRYIEGWNVSVRTPGMMERLRRWARREPKIARIFAIDLAAALLGGAILAYMYVEATWAQRDAVRQRDAAQKSEQVAKLERDRAATAGEIGAYLFAYKGEDRARDLIAWLRKRFPGDENRQADALTAFATSVEKDQRGDSSDLSELLTAVVTNLGSDYRHRVINALEAGNDKYRHVYSAMLAWSDMDGSKSSARFDALMQSAIKERPDDPFVRQVAFLFCPYPDEVRCNYSKAAETLVRIEPDNMYNWLLLQMWSTDASRKRDVLHEAAKRTRFDDYLPTEQNAYSTAIDAAAIPVPPLIARPMRLWSPNERPETMIAEIEGAKAPITAWQPLVRYCLPVDLNALDPQVRADCLTVGARMARSANAALIARMIGVAIVRPLAPGTPLAEEMKQLRRRYQYLGAMDSKLSRRQQMSYPSTRYIHDMSTVGELEAYQHRIEYFGMPGQPPADWQPEDLDTLLSSRERRDNTIAIDDRAVVLLDNKKYQAAAGLLVPAEKRFRNYFRTSDEWRLARFLQHLGRARAGTGQFAESEKNLLEAWKIAEPSGPSSGDAHACLHAIVALYTAWDAAEPGKGHSGKIAEWKQKLDDLEAADHATAKR
jgi:hypothetical protein